MIDYLNAESHYEELISVGNEVVTEGSMLLIYDEIDMLVVLCNNLEFMDFMR